MTKTVWDETWRDEFPRSLKSPATNKHTRYKGIPICCTGGKNLAAAHILERFPDKLETMASPFVCGKAMEMALQGKPALKLPPMMCFDILRNYQRVQLKRPAGHTRLNGWCRAGQRSATTDARSPTPRLAPSQQMSRSGYES